MTIRHREKGFTLIEAVIVIVVTGIVAAMAAVFIRGPIDAYFDTARRAELTDIADTAARRIARDINSALPNSVRQNGNFLEFVPIKDAGRYRADTGLAGAGDILDFDLNADATFDVLGPPVNIASGDSIVIYNQGFPGVSDVYDTGPLTSRRFAVAGTLLNNITFTPTATPFPFRSPGSRFQIVGTAVSYECAPDAANPLNGRLIRYSNYAIQQIQPAPFGSLPGLVTATLANNVSACTMAFAPAVLQRHGMLSIFLSISRDGEVVNLQHQVVVNNSP